jgi:[acyl-carrier-protein] S-malonyltransferase
LGYDLAQVCWQGPAAQLDRTDISQPALFVTSLAAVEGLRADSPQVFDEVVSAAGLSLGEYSALVFAGALDFEDALRVVKVRGEAMQLAAEQEPGGMVSVLGVSRDEVAAMCDEARIDGEVLQIANLLGPGNTVVSGGKRSCNRLMELAQLTGHAKVVVLAVAGAFHTPLMAPAVDRLSRALQSAVIRPPRVPVISNVDARPQTDPQRIRELLVEQVVKPVHWEASMRFLLDSGINTCYEVGPGRVLRGLLKRINRDVQCHSVAV